MVLVFNSSPYHKASYVNTANGFTGSIYAVSNSINQYFHLRRINDSLAEENARLYSALYKSDSSTHKADTLLSIDTANHYVGRFVYIAADVVRNSTASSNNYLMLNVGSANGVTKQCGVVCNEGVVGIVLDVSEHFCTVISLLNSNVRISSKLDSINNTGTLLWDGRSPEFAQINDINKHVKVEAEQRISTSGLNYFFPRNVTIGNVFESKIVGNTNNITVKLSTSFETLYKVYVVKNLDVEEQQKLSNSIK